MTASRFDPDGQRRAIRAEASRITPNAQDLMPRGGRLTLESANVDKPCFTRTTGKGTGLGPAAARDIVERHGGRVTGSRAPGHGASSTVSWPRLREAGVGDESEVERNRRSETILVVDDDEDVRELVREILELHGYRVLEAASTDEALTTAAAHSGQIALVLSDVVLPGSLSVREFRQRLERLFPHVKVVYMSGHAEHEIIQQTGNPGAWLVRKPFAVGTLVAMVRAALAD